MILNFIKKTDSRKSRNLTDLARGDNLEILGETAVVETVNEYKGLHMVGTIRILGLYETRTIRTSYSATKRMLKCGQLHTGMTTNFLATESEVEFYQQHLIQQPKELTV